MALPGYIDLAIASFHFSFQYLDTLSFEVAQNIALALSFSAEEDFFTLNPWFENALPFDARITVLIGTPGASGGGSAVAEAGNPNGVKEIFLGVSEQSSVDAVANVCTNELSEIFMIVQDRGWTVNGSSKVGGPGEALSRVIADALRPYVGIHDEGIQTWLFEVDPDKHVLRYNWVDVADGRDTYPHSWGCGMLFLYYLQSQLGFTMEAIINTAADTLARVHSHLTQAGSGFDVFAGLLAQKYPPNGPPYVEQDNPFPLPTPFRLSAVQYLRRTAPGIKQLRGLIGANKGQVRALLNSNRPTSLIQ